MSFLRGCLLVIFILFALLVGAIYMGYSWFTDSGKANLCVYYQTYQQYTMGMFPEIPSCDVEIAEHHRTTQISKPRSNFEAFGLSLLEEAQSLSETRPAKGAESSATYQFKFIPQQDHRIAQWSLALLAKSFTFNRSTYVATFQDSSYDFSQAGWLEFKKSVEESQLLNFVTEGDLILKAGLGASPAVMIDRSSEAYSGIIIGAPLVIGYGHTQLTKKQTLWVVIEIQQSPNARNGWLITRFMARPL